MAFNIVQMLYILYYIKKKYTWLDLSVTPNYDAISQRNSVMVHQISGLIFQNTDVLILTLVCGLKTVSVYSMYVMLFGMIGTAISTINSGVSFAMGQAYNTDKKRFNILYNAFETYNMALTFSLYCVANIFIIPFLKLYTAGVTDINYIDSLLPYLFVATYLLSNGRSAAQRVIEYVREFHNIFLFVISSVIGTYLVLRFSANITEMANRYNCCNILFSRLCYWGENSLAIMCIHMFVIEILRALDYRLFNSFLPVLGESEGIFLGCVIMLCCEMIIPVLNKYFSFCIGKKKSFYGGGHQD